MWKLIKDSKYESEFGNLAPNIQKLIKGGEDDLMYSDDPIKLGERKRDMSFQGNPVWTYNVGRQWRILYNIGDDRNLNIICLVDVGDHKMYKRR